MEHNVARAEAYHCTKWHLDLSAVWPQCMGREVGGAAVPPFGELGSHLTQCVLCRGLPPY